MKQKTKLKTKTPVSHGSVVQNCLEVVVDTSSLNNDKKLNNRVNKHI